jgi:hypothetical protein
VSKAYIMKKSRAGKETMGRDGRIIGREERGGKV